MKTQININNIDESIYEFIVHSSKRIATKALYLNPIEFKKHIFSAAGITGDIKFDALPLIEDFVGMKFYENGITPYSVDNIEYCTNRAGQSTIVVTYKVME